MSGDDVLLSPVCLLCRTIVTISTFICLFAIVVQCKPRVWQYYYANITACFKMCVLEEEEDEEEENCI